MGVHAACLLFFHLCLLTVSAAAGSVETGRFAILRTEHCVKDGPRLASLAPDPLCLGPAMLLLNLGR